MKYTLLCAALVAAHTASGALLVTEFMADPTGTDVDREWFEIFNSGPLAIDLTGYAVGDGFDPNNTSTGEGMGVFPSGTIINPGQVFVIAANANGFNAFYGFLPNFEFANGTSTLGNNSNVPDLTQKEGWGNATAGLAIANGGDDVAILAPESTNLNPIFIDGGNHGSVQTFFSGAATLGVNQSYERVIADVDTNSASDWVVRTTGTATPGVVAVPEPSALSLLGLGVCVLMRRRNAR